MLTLGVDGGELVFIRGDITLFLQGVMGSGRRLALSLLTLRPCGPVRGPLEGAGSKEPGARSMCKTRQSGPVRPRGPQRCGLVRPKTPSPPAPLPETVRSMAGEGRGKRYGGWHGIAGRECHPSAPSHNHDRLDPPAAQRFSAFFPDLWLGLIDQVLPGKQANPGGGD